MPATKLIVEHSLGTSRHSPRRHAARVVRLRHEPSFCAPAFECSGGSSGTGNDDLIGAAHDGGGLPVQEDYFCTTTNLNSPERRTTRDVGTEVQSGAVRRSAHFRTTSLEARSSVTESGPSRAPDDPAGKSGLSDLAASR